MTGEGEGAMTQSRADRPAKISKVRCFLWECFDEAIHARFVWRLFPARLRHWVCDRYELSLGVLPDGLYRVRETDGDNARPQGRVEGGDPQGPAR